MCRVRLASETGQEEWVVLSPRATCQACLTHFSTRFCPAERRVKFSSTLVSSAVCTLGRIHVVFRSWTKIAKLLQGRSENAVKNRWNSAARKKGKAATQRVMPGSFKVSCFDFDLPSSALSKNFSNVFVVFVFVCSTQVGE